MSDASWSVIVAPAAARDLDRLPERAVGAAVGSFEALARNPYRVGKALHFELEGLWVARRGPYRVVYGIDEERREVNVVAVGHRADVYRRR